MALKRAAAPVGRVAADLALELLVEPVQLVEPVGDGLAVPAQRQLQRVVNVLVLIFAVAQRARLRASLASGSALAFVQTSTEPHNAVNLMAALVIFKALRARYSHLLGTASHLCTQLSSKGHTSTLSAVSKHHSSRTLCLQLHDL